MKQPPKSRDTERTLAGDFLRERPDRIPTDYWATDEVTSRLCRELGCRNVEELYTKLHIDGLVTIDPPRVNTHTPGDSATDLWGLRRRLIDYGEGTYDEFDNHPLAHMTTVGSSTPIPGPAPTTTTTTCSVK